MRKWILLILLTSILASLVLWAGRVVSSGKEKVTVAGYEAWPAEVIDEAAAIPVHNGDRIKPLSTYAKVLMLEIHGDHMISVLGKDGEKVTIGPVAFLMDALLRPQLSRQMPLFQVENASVLNALGLETKKVSDHYSYNTLAPSAVKLFELAQEYEKQKSEDIELDPEQAQTLALAQNLRSYEVFGRYFNFARAGIVLPVQPGMPEGSKPQMVTTSSFMVMAGEISKIIRQYQGSGEKIPSHLLPVLQQVLNHANDAKFGPMLIHPREGQRSWMTAGDAILRVFQGVEPDPKTIISDITSLEGLYKAYRLSPEELAKALTKTSGELRSNLTTQERQDLEREVAYNKANWFMWAIFACFLPAMVFIILSWLAPASFFGRFLAGLTALFTTTGLGLTIAGISQRALIMHRPPVGNLYDTIIFIAAGVVLIALLVELMSRRKLALGVAPFIGFFLLVLSWIYEREEGVDNLEPLIAVLRSNFWLTVHVPTITFGYAAGLAAWLFGAVYIFVRMLGLDKDDPSLRKLIARMTYGSVCFTLLLSLIGTVTGGIWANDSWGRFWGWDPKENGALMIVLWTLFILHARLGGIIKEWGLHLAAVITGPIVVFSWWHVNLLGVGLHSYGFSDSKANAVNLFYTVNAVLFIVGLITAAITKRKSIP